MKLNKRMRYAAKDLDNMTDDLANFSKVQAGKFVILTKTAQAVYPDGETPEYVGDIAFTDLAGDTYAADMKAFEASYTAFRHDNGTTIYASKAIGNLDAQREAFVEVAAVSIIAPRNQGTEALLSAVRPDEMKVIETKAQAGIGQGGWADCSANGTGTGQVPGLKAA